MHIHRSLAMKISVFCAALLLMLAACGATPDQVAPQQTVTIGKTFQSQVSPIPPVPKYLCGAWSSNNAPGHFQGGDQQLDQHPTSDNGGYVSFTLNLQGRQPVEIPATVDVIFGLPGVTLHCTPAFFTPM